ncbi:hypothetical protein SAMN04487979_10314 [Flavobacterium sp. ov086]|nr:hypothetical protein SAMN04487979_10314 [Flavobacterium sp. ov086]
MILEVFRLMGLYDLSSQFKTYRKRIIESDVKGRDLNYLNKKFNFSF